MEGQQYAGVKGHAGDPATAQHEPDSLVRLTGVMSIVTAPRYPPCCAVKPFSDIDCVLPVCRRSIMEAQRNFAGTRSGRSGIPACMSDEQDMAERVDEDVVGTDAVTSDEMGAFDDAPDDPVGLPFADADTTDESLAERVLREEPEDVDDPNQPLRLVEPTALVDSDLLENVDEFGDLAEPE